MAGLKVFVYIQVVYYRSIFLTWLVFSARILEEVLEWNCSFTSEAGCRVKSELTSVAIKHQILAGKIGFQGYMHFFQVFLSGLQ